MRRRRWDNFTKLNCWEHRKCGRELGGKRTLREGVCPASIDSRYDGVHDGICAGRACWMVAGTLCDGFVKGSFARKRHDCRSCEFYNTVKEEEGDAFLMPDEIREREGDGFVRRRPANKGYDLSFLETSERRLNFPHPVANLLDDLEE